MSLPMWSAYFVSYCVKEASKTATGLTFPYADNHNTYAQALRGGQYPWTVINPNDKSLTDLRVGDIVVAINPLSPRPYQSFDSNPWSGYGHADIVTSVTPSQVQLTGGNLTNRVNNLVMTSLDRYPIPPYEPAKVVLRPNDASHGLAIADVARREFLRWEQNKWTSENQSGAFEQVKVYIAESGTPGGTAIAAASSVGGFSDLNIQLRDSVPAPRSTITPYISSLESFHPKIQQELLYRRFSSSTIDTFTPFVKLTSLLYVKNENLAIGGANTEVDTNVRTAWCPTLGVHGQQETSFDDIYLGQGQVKRSIVGYATQEQASPSGPKKYIRTPVYVTEQDATLDPPNIPPPGITNITTERSTAGPMGVRGGLFKANVKIVAYSVGQLNALMKYFMRPATRVVLEYGRLSGTDNPEGGVFTTTAFGLDDSSILQNDSGFTRPSGVNRPGVLYNYYNWNRSADDILNNERDGLKKFITLTKGQTGFLNDYVYYNYGNYEIFIGYVVKFTLKYGKNNTYEIDLTIHSVQQFEIPAKMTGAKPLCRVGTSVNDPCKVLDVHEYFSDDSTRKSNSFNYLLSKVLADPNASISKEWVSHIIPIKTLSDGNEASGANNPEIGTGIGGYYVSWKFFVNVILNDSQHGLMSIFRGNGIDNENYIKSNFLKPYGDRGTAPQPNSDSLLSGEVAYNKSLRSTNPGVMIVYNAGHQQNTEEQIKRISVLNEALRIVDPGYKAPDVKEGLIYNRIVNNTEVGSFGGGDGVGRRGPNGIETAFLNYGVWINTTAIKDAFANADTVSAGINNLLNYMNSSVGGYWNLQLISNDQQNPGLHVIDALSKFPESEQRGGSLELLPIELFKTPTEIFERNAQTGERGTLKYGIELFNGKTTLQITDDESVNVDRPKYIYVFNSKTKEFTNDDVGSELLDINITFDLPQAVAVQAIANVGGVAQRGTLNAIDIDELKSLSMVSSIYATCTGNTDTGVCTDDVPLPVSMETLAAARATEILNTFGRTRTVEPLFSKDQYDNKSGTLSDDEIVAARRVIKTFSLENLIILRTKIEKELSELEKVREKLIEENRRDTVTANEQFRQQHGLWDNALRTQLNIINSQETTLRENGITDPTATPGAFTTPGSFATAVQRNQSVPVAPFNIADLQETSLSATAQKLIDQNPNEVAAVREYGFLGQAIKLIELNPPAMTKQLDSNSSGLNSKNKVHPFNSSNLTKSIVDLTMPGIGGIQLFQTFAVDRVPQLLQRGVYVVTKVAHEFTVQNGWVTKIQGRFRYRPQNDE